MSDLPAIVLPARAGSCDVASELISGVITIQNFSIFLVCFLTVGILAVNCLMSPKRILVTGGNAGIGLALCKQLLLEDGCHVYLCSRSLDKGKAAIASLSLPAEVAERCTLVQLDAASDDSVAAAAATVAATVTPTDRLYAIVNNAGTGLAHGVTPDVLINTNLRGPKRVVDAFLPLLDAAGRIVNVGSGAGPSYVKALGNSAAAREIMNPVSWEQIEAHVKANLGGPADSMGGYGLSKACLTAYTMLLAKEHPNLAINCCSPGYIITGMTAGACARHLRATRLRGRRPRPRRSGSPPAPPGSDAALADRLRRHQAAGGGRRQQELINYYCTDIVS